MWLLSRSLRIVNYLSCIGGAVLMSRNVFLELTVVHTMLLYYSMETWEKKKIFMNQNQSFLLSISQKKKKHLVSLFQFSPYIGAKQRIKAWDSFLRSRETMFFLFLLMSPSYYSDQHPKETCPKLYHNVCPLLFVNGKITFNLGNWKLGPPTAYLDKPNPSNHSRWKQVLICLSFTLFSWNLAMIWKNTKLEKFFCLLWLKVESLLTYTSVHFSTTLQQG